ncbi:HBR326Cp [Eremothecium sinecaudum]|uniref:HBR326Cp n=1 Tax=Eremothecium sinecaudum TaxID=45286 RepID=A0A109UXP4_9SACH|nr:HBR326Cp [Eremothecium sinecaudum]AMD19227.1 HBR326Cp [Eremothecium sinecaudum]
MFTTPYFDEMEELYAAPKPITPSLSNSRPSNSDNMRYSTQPTGRLPLHDFRRDSLELYGLKPKHYQMADDQSEQGALSNDSSEPGSISFQPKWKDWIMEKRKGMEAYERQLDILKNTPDENEDDDFSNAFEMRSKAFNPQEHGNYTPFRDQKEIGDRDRFEALSSGCGKVLRVLEDNVRLFYDGEKPESEHGESFPGTFPRNSVYLPMGETEESPAGKVNVSPSVKEVQSVGPIDYLHQSVLLPLVVKLVVFVSLHLVAIPYSNYNFSKVNAASVQILQGLDQTITGLGGLFAAQQSLGYIVDFPLTCHSHYHLLRYGIEIVRDNSPEKVWLEYQDLLSSLHQRCLAEFNVKLRRKLLFTTFILGIFVTLSVLFTNWISDVTETNGIDGQCINIVFFGKAQIAGLVFSLLGQACCNFMSYFKEFIGEYAKDTTDLLINKLEQCKQQQIIQAQAQQHQQQPQKSYQHQQFQPQHQQRNVADTSETSEYKKDVLLISTPERSCSSVVYHPHAYVSPLNRRSNVNSGSLHLVDPSSPANLTPLSTATVTNDLDETMESLSYAPTTRKATARQPPAVIVVEQEHSYTGQFLRFIVKLPLRVVLLSCRATLYLLPWHFGIHMTTE